MERGGFDVLFVRVAAVAGFDSEHNGERVAAPLVIARTSSHGVVNVENRVLAEVAGKT
jgi:hypothetical protein